MKRFSEQLKKKSETLRLRASEKAELQSRIVAFMEYHPLPASIKAIPVPKSKSTMEPYRMVVVPRFYLQTFAGAFALFLIIGVPALAENAIPGDILYPVKVNVTEELRSTLSTNSYEKVAWETTRLERRVSEARLLAQAGKLTPEVEAGVLAAVKVHSEEAKRQIESLRETDADGAALAQMTFATALDVQSSVLKSDDSASTTANMSTVALASALDAGYSEAASESSADTLSVVRLIAQLEVETTRSYELLESIKDSATEQEQKDVRRRLSDLEHKIKLATKESTTDSEIVKNELRTAWTDLQKLISFMTDIDVRHSLSVETLVPVVLSNEEKLAQSIQHYERAAANFERITQGTPSIEDEAIAEKITATLPKIETLLLTATSTLYVDVNTAKTAVDEALALTDSILGMYQFPDLAAPIDSIPVDVATTASTTSGSDVSATTSTSTP
ncbi:MAG: DUF5667 domain-containing protein [Patescibacteria group bacterium]